MQLEEQELRAALAEPGQSAERNAEIRNQLAELMRLREDSGLG